MSMWELGDVLFRVVGERTILLTEIGSRCFGDHHERSDLDLFEVHVDPLREVLFRGPSTSGRHLRSGRVDLHSYEVSHVVREIVRGNVNFLIGVLSPIILFSTKEGSLLRDVTSANIHKGFYRSIEGIVKARLKAGSEKDIRMARRYISLGFSLVRDGVLSLSSFEGDLEELRREFTSSSLKKRADEEELIDAVVRIRLTMAGLSKIDC